MILHHHLAVSVLIINLIIIQTAALRQRQDDSKLSYSGDIIDNLNAPVASQVNDVVRQVIGGVIQRHDNNNYKNQLSNPPTLSNFIPTQDSASLSEPTVTGLNASDPNINTSNNNTDSTSDIVPPYMQHMTIILVILHMSVFIAGLVGNSLVCLSVYRNKSLQTVTNYYIVNLAVADFLVILICLPPTVYWDLTLTWNFGLVLCKLVVYLQSISVSVSVLTLTCISIDRWYAICRPLEFSSTKYRAKVTIALIWIVSMLIASPDVIFLTTRPIHEEKDYIYMDCDYAWPQSNTKIYQLCIVILLFAGPFVLMSISYSHIVNVLWRNETMAESFQHSSFQLEEEQQSLRRKYESISVTQTKENINIHDDESTNKTTDQVPIETVIEGGEGVVVVFGVSKVVVESEGDCSKGAEVEGQRTSISDKIFSSAVSPTIVTNKMCSSSQVDNNNNKKIPLVHKCDCSLSDRNRSSNNSSQLIPSNCNCNNFGNRRSKAHKEDLLMPNVANYAANKRRHTIEIFEDDYVCSSGANSGSKGSFSQHHHDGDHNVNLRCLNLNLMSSNVLGSSCKGTRITSLNSKENPDICTTEYDSAIEHLAPRHTRRRQTTSSMATTTIIEEDGNSSSSGRSITNNNKNWASLVNREGSDDVKAANKDIVGFDQQIELLNDDDMQTNSGGKLNEAKKTASNNHSVCLVDQPMLLNPMGETDLAPNFTRLEAKKFDRKESGNRVLRGSDANQNNATNHQSMVQLDFLDRHDKSSINCTDDRLALKVSVSTEPDHSFRCCKCCFFRPQRRKSTAGEVKDKTSKKYRKNLANYAAKRDKYRETSCSGRSSRQTLLRSSVTNNCSPKLGNCNRSSIQVSDADHQQKQHHGQRQQSTLLTVGPPAILEETTYSSDHSRRSTNVASTNGDHPTNGSASLLANHFNQQYASSHTRFCKLIESRKKAAKMLIVIVIMFGLCYLPVHFLNILRYTIGLPQNDITTIASLVSHWLCYFNSAVNPLIYNLMSGKFRHEFANLFFCKCFRRKGG